MSAPMRVVACSQAPEPPYPAETKSKGWRFELDSEQLEQSDTWALAGLPEHGPEMRPWLLMLWYTAWRQIPCGSLPAQDALIAARIGMPVRQFSACRDLLMRGWWLASDGRMYHKTITDQVLKLSGWRDAEAKRKAEWRAAKEAERLEKQGLGGKCPTGQTRDGHVNPPSATTPSPSPSPSPSPLLNTGETGGQAATPPRRGRKPSEDRTLSDWIAAMREKGEDAIPENDPVYATAQAAGLPAEFVQLAWFAFKRKYGPGGMGKDRKYKDWRATFRTAVSECWGHLWMLDNMTNEFRLTTAGTQAQREFESQT